MRLPASLATIAVLCLLTYPGLEIIAKPATVLEAEPAELLRVASGNARRRQ